jgi:DNA repair exonuclease SbcCD ATPase subunit
MKICSECKYERTAQDELLFPDYECPSCGIIFEKDKAKQELAELEKQRENERKAKLKRLKKEEQERLQREEQERKEQLETERRQKLEAERVRQEEEDRKRKQEEKRLKREAQARKEKEEKERQQKLEAERIRQEKEERKRREKEERLRKEEEEEQRQTLEAQKKQAEKAQNLLKQRQEKIEQIAQKNPDKIISATETEQTYQLFDMCPFNMAQTGKGLSIVGFGESKNKWQHARCMQKYCRLWTWKTDENGEVYGQGCSLQFLGLNKEEIKKNFLLKNRQILEDTYPPPDTNNTPEDQK